MLKGQDVSAHLVGMLTSRDLKITVGATQMAHILMQKLPDVFRVHLRQEGVTHLFQWLADKRTAESQVIGTTSAESTWIRHHSKLFLSTYYQSRPAAVQSMKQQTRQIRSDVARRPPSLGESDDEEVGDNSSMSLNQNVSSYDPEIVDGAQQRPADLTGIEDGQDGGSDWGDVEKDNFIDDADPPSFDDVRHAVDENPAQVGLMPNNRPATTKYVKLVTHRS